MSRTGKAGRISRRALLKGGLAFAGTAALGPPQAACGGRDRAGNEERPGPDEQRTVDFWHLELFSGGIEPLIERFGETHPNIAVKGRSFADYTALSEAIQAAIAAQDPPAVSHVGFEFLRYAAANLPHTPAEEVVGREWLKTFPASTLELGRVDDVLHGMPHVMGTRGLLFNRDLFEQAGLEGAPRTWEEVREYARRIKDETGSVGLYVNESTGFSDHHAMIESNGGRMLIESGNGFRTGVDGPEAVEAMRFHADMVLEGETAAHLASEEGLQAFSAGEIGMLVGVYTFYLTFEQSAPFEVGFGAFPSFGQRAVQIPIGGANNFVFATDPNERSAARELVRFLGSPRSITTWVNETYLQPPRPELGTDPRYLKPFFEKEPLMKVANDSLRYASPFTSWPGTNGLQASQVLVDAKDKFLSGREDVDAALGEAAGRINELINS